MKRLFSMAVMTSVLYSAAFAQDTAVKRAAAEKSAQNWLVLVDSGHYGESWQEAATFFQSKISKADWQTALKQVRTPLGSVRERTLLGSIYKSDLPNAPKGEYVIVQFKTKFATKGAFVETVTPMLDEGGNWRVSGYFVKPAQ